MSYSQSHVILIAFAIDTPDSLDNVTVKVLSPAFLLRCRLLTPPVALPVDRGGALDLWPPHSRYPRRVQVGPSPANRFVSRCLARAPCTLTRLSGSPNYSQFVAREQAERVAQAIGARAYKECSALKIEGVDDVFEAATRASMLMREGVPAHAGHQHNRLGGSMGHRRGSSSGDGWEDKGRCCVIC